MHMDVERKTLFSICNGAGMYHIHVLLLSENYLRDRESYPNTHTHTHAHTHTEREREIHRNRMVIVPVCT